MQLPLRLYFADPSLKLQVPTYIVAERRAAIRRSLVNGDAVSTICKGFHLAAFQVSPVNRLVFNAELLTTYWIALVEHPVAFDHWPVKRLNKPINGFLDHLFSRHLYSAQLHVCEAFGSVHRVTFYLLPTDLKSEKHCHQQRI